MDEVIGQQSVGRRIDSVTMSMIGTYMKMIEHIHEKYKKLESIPFNRARGLIRDTIEKIPTYDRTQEEAVLFDKLCRCTNYSLVDKETEEINEIAEKIRKLLEDDLLHQFVMPYGRKCECMYVQRVFTGYQSGTSRYSSVLMSGPMIHCNKQVHNGVCSLLDLRCNGMGMLTSVNIISIGTIENDIKDYCNAVMASFDEFKVMCTQSNDLE